MIITQNTTNDLVFYVNPSLDYLLVRMVNIVTCEEFAFIVQDTTTDCSFVVTSMIEPGRTGSNDAINGTLKIGSGSYDLYVYEQSSSTNLDYTLSSAELLKIHAYVISDEDCNRNHI